jgi:hypothetical protein
MVKELMIFFKEEKRGMASKHRDILKPEQMQREIVKMIMRRTMGWIYHG